MRPIISLLIAFLMAGTLTACGQGEPAPADAVPAPEPVPVEQVREDPFAAYFDLSGLSDETLDQARQVIDQESTQDGVTVHVSQTLGDGRSLYVAFDAIYPEQADPTEFPTVRLAKGAVDDPIQAEELPGLINSGINGAQTQENTMSYLAEFDFREPCLTGQEVSLLVEDPATGGVHMFTWTAENEGFFAQANLMDQTGRTVGSAALSSFLLTLELPRTDDWTHNQWTALAETLQLLDADGNPLQGFMNWQGGNGVFYAQFYSPIGPGAAATIQAENCTGTFQ